jgi:holo-[acyl-carrier protein] synthase
MIIGIGTDLVENRRLERWLSNPGLLAKYFTEAELSDVGSSSHPSASLAARFAAKEAFGKALGTGLAGIRLGDIQVVNDRNGRPEIVLHGTALARFGAAGASRVHVSLTHERDNAVAVAIIEG